MFAVAQASTPSSPSAFASSSRLSETPVKQETHHIALADACSNSSKKRKLIDERDDHDEDVDDSSSSPSASPSKSSNTGGRRKASDEERKARLEARQARNRLSAQYSRERKKAYVETLEGSLNALKAENTLLRQQREQDQALQQTLDAKLKDAQLRVNTLETILRTLAPSLVPLLGPSSLLSLPSSSNPSVLATSPASSLAPQFDAGLSANLASASVQDNSSASKEVPLSLAIAAPASTVSTPFSFGTLAQQSSNEGVRLPAADALTQFESVAGKQSALEKAGNNVDVNGSSIVNQGYPLASQISVSAPEQPSSFAASAQVPLPQHVVEAKAAGVAREAEALLSNFIDLDAKLANGDAKTAAQDQGAPTSATPSEPVSVGEGYAAAAGNALRSASAAAGDLASLSAASSADSGDGSSGSSDGSKTNNENGGSTIFNTISLSHADNKDQDLEKRFQLLTSPLLATERNVWELVTDTMLQDLYSGSDEVGAISGNADPALTPSEVDMSAGSSPFDLVDLDIEIEEPLQVNIGLETEDAVHGGLLGFGHEKPDAGVPDWSGLMASIVA